MGPFGRAAVSSIISRDVGKKKDVKNKKGVEEKRVTEDVKKDTTVERRSSTRLFSWSKDDSSSRGSGEKVEKGRRISAPGKVQTTTTSDSMAESPSFLGSEFGFALGLNRIKTRSGPLYSTSTRSGPVFAGTLQSRFNIGNEKREEGSVQSSSSSGYSSRSPSVRGKSTKAAKVHARDSVSPKDSLTEDVSKCRGRRCTQAESKDIDSCGSPFVAVSKLGLGNDKISERSSSEASQLSTEDAEVSPSERSGSWLKEASVGQVSQPESASSWVDIDSNFDTGSIGGISFGGSPVGIQHARSVPAGSESQLQG